LLSPNLIRDFCRTISQIKNLKTLLLFDPQPQKNFSLQVFEKLFFSCPPSLVEFSVCGSIDMSTEDMDLDPYKNDWDYDQGPLLLRKETLRRLKSLQLPSIDGQTGRSGPFLSSILQHCPALEEATLPPLRDLKMVQAVSQIIGASCPNIAGLIFPFTRNGNDEAFLTVMDRMHEQRLERILVDSFAEKSSGLLSSSAFLRHSTTLRQVEFRDCRRLQSVTLRTILTSCHALKIFKVLKGHGTGTSDGVALNLEDAIETEWACTRIQHLAILVKLTPNGRDPTYLKDPTMSTWTQEDHDHWSMLDKFYTQIGTLRELKILCLNAVGPRPPSRYELRSDVPFRRTCLPGLLALEDTTTMTRQVGFLSKLAGLDKLQELIGSFSVTSTRMGQREVEWFVGHLPALRRASFVWITYSDNYRDKLPKIINDLQKLRPELVLIDFIYR
jgi:hypothetical protein